MRVSTVLKQFIARASFLLQSRGLKCACRKRMIIPAREREIIRSAQCRCIYIPNPYIIYAKAIDKLCDAYKQFLHILSSSMLKLLNNGDRDNQRQKKEFFNYPLTIIFKAFKVYSSASARSERDAGIDCSRERYSIIEIDRGTC